MKDLNMKDIMTSTFQVISAEAMNEILSIKVPDRVNNIVLIGMGASNANTRAILSFVHIDRKIIYLDSLEREVLDNLITPIRSADTIFVAVSKSGNTDEVLRILDYIITKIPDPLFYIVSSGKGSKLANFQKKIANSRFIEYEKSESGRFSILQNASLLVPHLAGVNLRALVDNLNLNQSLESSRLLEFIISDVNCGRNIMVISIYNKKLEGFAIWLRQIIAESLGKNGVGITPVISFGSVCEHSQMQLYQDGPDDKFYYILPLENVLGSNPIHSLDLSLQAHAKSFVAALENAGRPILKEQVANIDLIPKWMSAIHDFAKLKNINPFNQEAVEQMKLHHFPL